MARWKLICRGNVKRLQRYIFFSVLAAALAAAGLFTFVLLTGNVVKELAGLLAAGRISLAGFIQLLLLLAPFVAAYALPLGTLCGVLIVMGRLSARREVVAMRAAGLSLWFLSAPVMAVAMLAGAAAGFVNCFYAPAARGQYRALLRKMAREDPLRFIVPGTFTDDFPGCILYAGEREGNRLKDFWIWELDARRRAVKLLRAREGEIRFDEENDALLLVLTGASSELRSGKNPDDMRPVRPLAVFDEAVVRLPLDRLLGGGKRRLKLSHLDWFQLRERRAGLAEQIRGLPADSSPAERRRLEERKMRTQTQMQRNLAAAFSVISLALLGIPLGVRTGRAETYANAALALALAMIYYFLVIAAEWFEGAPALRPDLLMWLPNILFQTIGLVLIFRANR